MMPGSLPADWRMKLQLVNASVNSSQPFADIEDAESIAELNSRSDLMAGLSRLDVNEIDIGVLTGSNRRATRFIAEYLHDMEDDTGAPMWSGIRYTSRTGRFFECWAVFEGVDIEVISQTSIESTHPALLKVANRFGLTVH